MSHHRVICGHVIPALKSLPDEHVDMLMTSVPYWGLRDYGADTATIWGGDKDCEHDFSLSQAEHDNLHYRGADSIVGNEKNKEIHKEKENIAGEIRIPEYAASYFCSKCGAWEGQLGLENTPEEYITHLRMVFAEVKRVLKKTATCWVNIGDSYAGSSKGIGSSPDPKWEKARNDDMKHKTDWDGIDLPAKCMCMIPERFAFMMIDLNYILRNKIIWHKPNPMPSSVKDRFNTTYELLYFFSKSRKYWFDLDAVREEHKWVDKNGRRIGSDTIGATSKRKRFDKTMGGGGSGFNGHSGNYKVDGTPLNNPLGKNPGDFWSINTQPFPEAHFAVFPEKLCEKPILAGCSAEVCKHCGMARVRITEQGDLVPDDPKYTPRGQYHGKEVHPGMTPSGKDKPHPNFHYEKETIGWSDCQCKDENKYEPGIIIDIFGGSGTASIEAEKLGRSSILIDIKRDYCEMAFKRLKPLVEQTDLSGKQSTIERIGF